MDTFVEKTEYEFNQRTCEYCLSILLFIFLVLVHSFFQAPIYANDILANTVITTPALIKNIDVAKGVTDNELLKSQFNERVASKYSNWNVNTVADGIKHVKMVKYYSGKPVRINIVEINETVAHDYEVKPAIASKTLPNKRTIRTIAQNTNSVAAINGGFFKPQTGVPLGTLMIDGKMVTGPIYDRVALGIFDDGYDVGRVMLDAKIVGNGETIKIDNINQPRMLSSYILLYTRDWGAYAPASPQYGVQLRVEGDKITAASANPLSIPENGYVLVGPKSQLGKLFGAEYVDISINTNPKWENVRHIISGGPYLVKNGDVFVDVEAQKLQSIGGRNPRSAIGYTKYNDLILVAVDGREGSSVGLTLYELAALMQSLGCVNAINLDGGGSTVMFVNGQIVNRPQQAGGIALSNAVVVSKKTNN
ncbi:MAG: phosphodiester glycosidase family protein [Candidatus Gastranaerophilaceae bacterium]